MSGSDVTSPQLKALFAQVLTKLCVGLCYFHGPANRDGQFVQQPGCRIATGFLARLPLSDDVLLVTAAHVFADLARDCADGNVAKSFRILDDWSGSMSHPIPFDWSSTHRLVFEDDTRGLDVAIVQLPAYVQELLRCSQLRVFSIASWSDISDQRFDFYCVAGLPNGLMNYSTSDNGCGEHGIDVQSRLAYSLLDRCVDTATTFGFSGKLVDSDIGDIAGMSGGPVFGLNLEGGDVLATPVAVQSRWIESEQVVRGTLLSLVREEIIRDIKSYTSQSIGEQ